MKKRYLIPVALFLAIGVFVPGDEVAADCVDWSGYTRPCSQTEQFDYCLTTAVDAADQRAREGTESSLLRYISFNIDVGACTASYLLPFI
jgi:hypothetical protein